MGAGPAGNRQHQIRWDGTLGPGATVTLRFPVVAAPFACINDPTLRVPITGAFEARSPGFDGDNLTADIAFAVDCSSVASLARSR